jgi:CBS domain-containing protein
MDNDIGSESTERENMKTVTQLLQGKGHEVLTISPEASVFEALQVMAERNIGAVLVLEGKTLVGILSERDYARKVILKGKASKDIPVREIMTSHVLYVRPQQTIDECMALMTDKRVRHLPVLEEDRLVGVISIGDVVKAIIAEQEFLIEQLQNYITGR